MQVQGGPLQTLGPGEQFTVQPGSWHRWWNPGRSEVRIRTRIEPALRFDARVMPMEAATLEIAGSADSVTRFVRFAVARFGEHARAGQAGNSRADDRDDGG